MMPKIRGGCDMEIAISSRNCCYWPVSFKKRIESFCDLEMRKIEYNLHFRPDVTEENLSYLQRKVKSDEIEIVGIHGELTDTKLERIADKLRCQTISVHVNEIDLQRISSLADYNLLVEYPEKNIESKKALLRLLENVKGDVGVLVDLPEVYVFKLIKETNIEEHLSSFWKKIRAFHISDIVGSLYNMAVGMGLSSVDFTILRKSKALPIIEIHPNYGIFDLIASKYNLEKIVAGRGQLPKTEMLDKYSKEFDLKNLSRMLKRKRIT